MFLALLYNWIFSFSQFPSLKKVYPYTQTYRSKGGTSFSLPFPPLAHTLGQLLEHLDSHVKVDTGVRD